MAVLATMSIGIGEFVAAGVTKRARSNEVTVTMFGAGVVLTAMLALIWPGKPTGSDVVAMKAIGGVCHWRSWPERYLERC